MLIEKRFANEETNLQKWAEKELSHIQNVALLVSELNFRDGEGDLDIAERIDIPARLVLVYKDEQPIGLYLQTKKAKKLLCVFSSGTMDFNEMQDSFHQLSLA